MNPENTRGGEEGKDSFESAKEYAELKSNLEFHSAVEQKLLSIPTPHEDMLRLYEEDRYSNAEKLKPMFDSVTQEIYGHPNEKVAKAYELVLKKTIMPEGPPPVTRERYSPSFVVDILREYPLPSMLDAALEVRRDISEGSLKEEQKTASGQRADLLKLESAYQEQFHKDPRLKQGYEDFKQFLYGDRYDAERKSHEAESNSNE